MASNNKNLTQALKYLKQGWSVIPLRPNEKKPLGEWKKYQTQYATEEEVRAWFEKCSDINIGIVTGAISQLVVVDVDIQHNGKESMKQLELPTTHFVKTGSGGWHYYYRWDTGNPIPNRKAYLEGIDIQGEGAYIVAPPSIHPNGNEYIESTPLDELLEAPEWLVTLSNEQGEVKLWERGLDGVEEGQRNEAATSLIGKVLSSLPRSCWDTFAWTGLLKWNQKNKVPLPENELRSIFDSIAKREEENSDEDDCENPSIAKQIVDNVMKTNPVLFRDDLDVPFVRIQIGDHWEVHALHSKRFHQWVVRLYFKKTKKPPKTEHVKQALGVLESLALFEGDECSLESRVAKYQSEIWYDLVDDEWRAVKISHDGWELIEHPPTIFVRYTHQKTQVTPTNDGSLSDILDFVNIADQDQQLLFQVYLVTCFIPNIPHPVPILYGSQGSAKSTFLRIIRRLVDPSAVELLTFPTRKAELVQQLSHHHVALYDNVTSMAEWLSDSLCRAVTGEGFTKRELYSNDEDIIYTFRTCIGLNGINICATKADLLDRSILFGLERISPNQRRDEQSFWERFEEKRPAILGAIFDALSGAMTLRPTIIVEQLPRMADFTLWGCAIAEALGYGQEAFLGAYRRNIDKQNQEAIHEHPVATAVVALMEIQEEWSGTPTDLLEQLNTIAEEQKIDTRQRLWPKAAQVLTKRLNEARTNLETIGIIIGLGSSGHGRRITIIKKTVGTAVPQETNSTDSSNGSSETNTHDQGTLDLIRTNLDPNARFAD